MIDLDLLLAWGGAYKKARAGEIIFQEGQSCIFYYQLLSGNIKWVNINNEGKECVHAIAGPGEPVGELPLFDNQPYAANAIAESECLLIRLNKISFMQLLKENVDLHFAFTKMLSKRIRYSFSLLNSYFTHHPHDRVATLINSLKKENRNIDHNTGQLMLTRKQIADMTGLRIETVIRTIRSMHEKGDLTICKGKVFCENMIQLIQL